MDNGRNICPNCGREVGEGAYMCLNCGKLITNKTNAKSDNNVDINDTINKTVNKGIKHIFSNKLFTVFASTGIVGVIVVVVFGVIRSMFFNSLISQADMDNNMLTSLTSHVSPIVYNGEKIPTGTVGDSFVVNGLHIDLEDASIFKNIPGNRYVDEPDIDNEFFVMFFTISSTSIGFVSFDYHDIIAYADDKMVSVVTNLNNEPNGYSFLNGMVFPYIGKKGYIAFQVNERARDF